MLFCRRLLQGLAGVEELNLAFYFLIVFHSKIHVVNVSGRIDCRVLKPQPLFTAVDNSCVRII
jgi:hypothetical protein